MVDSPRCAVGKKHNFVVFQLNVWELFTPGTTGARQKNRRNIHNTGFSMNRPNTNDFNDFHLF